MCNRTLLAYSPVQDQNVASRMKCWNGCVNQSHNQPINETTACPTMLWLAGRKWRLGWSGGRDSSSHS
eukprot:860718-Pyramimonas_sp.AAC.2